MPETFIDSHVHFWNQINLPYPWLADVPAIAGPHTPRDLHAEASADLPAKIVFVECGAPWLEEVKWIEHLAASEPRIGAIVAKIELDAGDATTSAIHELQRHPLVRGVRRNIQDERDPAYCLCPEFLSGIRQLAAANFSFDICCRHHQLTAVGELVRRAPETRFILDHAGKPDIRAGLLDPWRKNIAALAALPNVDCKLSGLVTEADHGGWTLEHLRPYVAHLFETFGPARLMFGSDWPVAKLAGGYIGWLDAARQLVSDIAPQAARAVFQENAVRAYRL